MVNQSVLDRSEFKPQYFEKADNPPAQVERDLRRLEGLIRQSKRKGLNSIESTEKQELIDQYDMEHWKAFQLKFKKE